MASDLEVSFPSTPPPYSCDQSRKVAKLVVDTLQDMIKVVEDVNEEHEKEWDLEEIRTRQGVGIVLAALLHQFTRGDNPYIEADEQLKVATAKAYYFLEDF